MKVSNRSRQVAQTIQEQLMAGGMEKVMSLGYRDWETDRKSTRLNSSH